MKKLFFVLVLLVSNSLLSQNPLHDTILKQSYRNDTITEELFDAETINSIMIELINDYRVENGLEPFIVDTLLMRFSNRHAKWMAETRIYCHTSDKRTPYWTDHKKENFAENCTMADNIYLWDTHYTLSDMAVGQWILSSGHNRNILDPNYKYIGAGSFQKMTPEGKKGQYFVVQFREYR
jgi:uncharacterized protein YkwD